MFGVTKIPPYSHFWYPILASVNDNAVIRVIVDQVVQIELSKLEKITFLLLFIQIFWRPFLTAYTFLFMGIVQGLSWEEIKVVNSWPLHTTTLNTPLFRRLHIVLVLVGRTNFGGTSGIPQKQALRSGQRVRLTTK